MSIPAGFENHSGRMERPSEGHQEAQLASSRFLAESQQERFPLSGSSSQRDGASNDWRQYSGSDTSSQHLPSFMLSESGEITKELNILKSEYQTLEHIYQELTGDSVSNSIDTTSSGSSESAVASPPNTSTGESAVASPPNTSTGESAVASPPNNSTGESAVASPPNTSTGESAVASTPNNSTGESAVASTPNTSTGESAVASTPNTSTGESAVASPPNTSTGESAVASTPNTSTGESAVASTPNTSTGEFAVASTPNTSTGESAVASTPNTSTGTGDGTISTTSATDTGASVSSANTSSGDSGFVGMFGGDTDAQEANSFASALGKTVIPSTYLDYRQPEAQTAQYNIGQYGSWTAAHPGVGMIVGVPLTFNGQSLASTADGSNNAEYTALAQSLVAAGQGNDTIRLGIEMNGSWAVDNNDGNPTDSVNAYNNAAEAMKAVPGANFSFDWNVSNGDQNGIANTAYYPGNANVNSIGDDVYDWNEQSGSSATPAATWNLLTTEAGGLNDMAAFAQQQGKTFAIPEYAVSSPEGQAGNANATSPGMGDDPSFINNIANFLNTQSKNEGVAFQAYFDSASGGVGTDLEDSPNSYAAYVQDFSNGGVDGAET